MNAISRLSLLTASFVLLPLMGHSQLNMTFDEGTFRPNQRLWGQGVPGATWQGTSNPAYSVRAGVGVDGSRAVQVSDRNLQFDAVTLDVTNEALGGEFDPESSVVHYSLAVKMEEVSGEGLSARIRLAGQAVQLELYNSGDLYFMDGGDADQPHRTVYQANRNHFVAEKGEFFIIDAEVDYGSKTFRLKVNDVPQQQGNPIAFRTTGDATGDKVDFWIAAWMQTHEDWRPFVFDNVQARLID
ncbi:MAG: hypothetical protein JJT75_04255 [Opitutales bacterium]|nr:hypothetical protein [Opitutales bacterium]